MQLCQESKDIPPQTFKIADAGTERMLLDTSGTTDQVTVFYSSTDPQFGTYRYNISKCMEEKKMVE